MKVMGGLLVILVIVLILRCSDMKPAIDRESEIAAITDAIHTSIEWCIPEKDRTRLYAHTLRDSAFFMFQPGAQSTIRSFAEFEQYAERVFFDPRFKAISSDIRELRINLSESGDVAWFSCMLDDIGEWDGNRIEWRDARWTGVLIKRDGTWLLAQQHFSLPAGG